MFIYRSELVALPEDKLLLCGQAPDAMAMQNSPGEAVSPVMEDLVVEPRLNGRPIGLEFDGMQVYFAAEVIPDGDTHGSPVDDNIKPFIVQRRDRPIDVTHRDGEVQVAVFTRLVP